MIRRVLAIIVDYGGREDTERLSLELARARHEGFELDIVHADNGNREPTRLSDAQKAAGVSLLRLDRNYGYAGAINRAVEAFRDRGHDAYWFLNSDLRVEADCLQKLVGVLDREQKVAAVGPVVIWGDGPRVWGARGVVSPVLGTTAMTDWKGGLLPRWSYIPGCSLLTRADAYRSTGRMPDRYKLYFEEAHYCVQLQKAGWELWVEPSARVHHLVKSMESGVPARHFAYYFARNGLYFWETCFGIPWYVQLARTLPVVGKEVILPLRRARNVGEAADRLKFALAGLWDGVSFIKNPHPYFESKLFHD